MKTCRICHLTKPLTEFYADQRARDGHRGYCKECSKATSRRWRSDNHEQALANCARWRAEHPEYRHVYNSDHGELVSATAAKWYAENGDRIRACQQLYRQSDHSRLLRIGRQSRRRAMEITTAVEAVSHAEILERYGMVCHICGERIVSRTHLHFDHVVPLALGGPHVEENIRPAHAVCNLRKGARLLEGVA